MTIAAGLLFAMTLGAADTSVAPPAALDDATVVASAFDGRRLQLEMRGQRVSVDATAETAEQGCATRIIAQAPGGSSRWSRLLRWNELAWAGMTAEGFTQAAFYDFEGHLATDLVAFAPADPPEFRAALARLVQACRDRSGADTRVLFSEGLRTRTCFLIARPEIQIIDSQPGIGSPSPPRLAIDLHSQESPRVELQMFYEGTGEDARSSPLIGFVVAEPALLGNRVERASFLVEGTEFTVRHSVAAFGTTRLRITMGSRDTGFTAFADAVSSAGDVTLSLWARDGTALDRFSFRPGPALARARELLTGEDLSCTSAVAPAPRAANWQAVR